MAKIQNPALEEFLAQMGNELVLSQVLIRRAGAGFELRHAADGAAAAESLRLIKVEELRRLAQFTADGQFRPLKSAPNLPRDWCALPGNPEELARALEQLYPGALADWCAARISPPPVTHFREFTARQSGMYRVAAMLTDDQAAQVIQAACNSNCCLKRRLWTVAGTPEDAPAAKSLIPCLEPCAILLEAARQAFRAAAKPQEIKT